MSRTLMPTPDDPRPDMRTLLGGAHLDPEAQAVLDFLRGEYAPVTGRSPPEVVPAELLPHPGTGRDRRVRAWCSRPPHEHRRRLARATGTTTTSTTSACGFASCALPSGLARTSSPISPDWTVPTSAGWNADSTT